ncbi:hypothetical protein M9Y10_044271 [Tritrichomonas musculus]|uniref:TAF6 C-terminal HEAT repeat domain-containing protein n=1 Tax=Tritrichomonas musculus TaxID=1915356 RepID=A0ABR2K226_9EUKA
MCSTSVITVQAIADMLGITISKPTLVQSLAQEAEDFIAEYIRSASLLAINSRSYRLSAQHINRVLFSERYMNKLTRSPCNDRLFGYEFAPFGQYLSIPFEQSELYVPRENSIKCRNVIKSDIVPPNNQTFDFQFLLTEGVYADKKMLSVRRLIIKTPKILERAISAPISQFQNTQQTSEFFKRNPVSISKLTFSHIPLVHDVLNNTLQLYYSYILNLIRDDSPYVRDTALSRIETDVGLQQLLPYFLQYIIYNMTIFYQNIEQMTNLIKITRSLIRNSSLCSSIYAHTFLKIIFSALIGADYTSELHGDDTKLRELAADTLKLIIDKYQSCFHDIKICIFNSLIEVLFDPNTSLMAHYGAICGIEAIDENAVKYIIPHLKHYLKMMDFEIHCYNPRQRQCSQLICSKVKQLITKI